MRLLKVSQIMVFLTVLGLVYIHMQMKIIDLAYQGKEKEMQLRSIIEYNSNLTYEILTRKSPNNLGITLLAEESEMEFVDPENIMQLSEQLEVERRPLEHRSYNQLAKEFMSMLSLGTSAEAKIKD